MARADLLKKLFSSYKSNDEDSFYSIANEIIEDEKKKNHGILADELKMILFNGYNENRTSPKTLKTYVPKDSDKDVPLVDIVYPEKSLKDLILSEEKKQTIESIIKEFINWDLLVANGVTPNRRVLFYGPPGCGKTVTANAIATELGIPMIYVRFDAVVSSFLGETASNLRKVFDFAKKDNWVLFFDEFDSIARSRNDSTEHGEIKRVVNTFLQQLDNFKGHSLIISATNFESSLDYAIWRRFDETINFELPTHDEIKSLIELGLKRLNGPIHVFKKYFDDFSNFSHADIEKLCQIILKRCIFDGRKMYTVNDIEYAVNRQVEMVRLRKTNY